ncbi:hypothetical protein GIB67_015610 [Kingdonia uniflora]|uniref:FAS1 domain-containing protein n=1 Tax=Kingdonia uniflora TaxID=39325 RepID=A0A7J7NUS4_9MAGN|nr:hypothetical protein GIB67_015610 [Kingdonia uniflora]
MATSSPLVLILLATSFLFIAPLNVQAQSAPAPGPPGPLNLTGILDKAGQYTTLIRLLTSTQVGNQIDNQLNSSDQGLTVFAPTDNAFNNLKAGTLNGLSTQEQVALVLYHVLPKFYSKDMFETVSNPVRTQATGQDGAAYVLNITSGSNQLNISTGVVKTQLNNVIRGTFPLAVYEVDDVLLPLDLFGPKTAKPSPPPSATPTKKTPSMPSAGEPAPVGDSKSSSPKIIVGSGFGLGLGLVCMCIFW